jgi:hypothetical protein
VQKSKIYALKRTEKPVFLRDMYLFCAFMIFLLAKTVNYRDYRQLDLNAILGRCMTLPWSDFNRTLDPIEKLSCLNDFITGLFDEFVPLKTRRGVDSDTLWFDAYVGRAVLEFKFF